MKLPRISREHLSGLKSGVRFSTKPNFRYIFSSIALSLFFVVGLRNFFHPIPNTTQFGILIFLAFVMAIPFLGLFFITKALVLQRIHISEGGLIASDIWRNRKYFFPFQAIHRAGTGELDLGRGGKYNYFEISLAPRSLENWRNRFRLYFVGLDQLHALRDALLSHPPQYWEASVSPGAVKFRNLQTTESSEVHGASRIDMVGWYLFDLVFLGYIIFLISVAQRIQW